MGGATFPGMERSGTRCLAKRFALAAACTLVILLAVWLPLVAYVHSGGMKAQKMIDAAWVTGEETRRLMRYHGTSVLMITQDRVYILRESRWIPVRKRKEG